MGHARLFVGLLASAFSVLAQPGCQTETKYNPIAGEYPEAITGVMNGTFALAFIPRDTADSLLPEGFEFLDGLYEQGVQMWQEDAFPVLIKAVHIHDIRAPDDLWRNDHTLISFELPFVDAMKDGKSPFRYPYAQFLSTGTPSYANDVAEAYGVPHIIRSVYNPECDAYQWTDPEAPADGAANPAKLKGIPADGSMRNVEVVAGRQVTREARPFTTEQLKMIVGQSRFGVGSEGLLCGGTIVYWDEDIGFGELVQTKGEITLSGEFEELDAFLEGESEWGRVYGIRAGTAFIEEDFVDCWTLSVAGGENK